MNLSRIDLNLLVVFDTVYREGGITAASRRLHLSQPAVSHALARLRETFGRPLFERSGRGVTPTPLAHSIAAPVREALSNLQRTLDAAGQFDPRSSRRAFRLGLREALEPSVLPGLTRALHGAGPALDLTAARHDRARLAHDLASGELDVALDVLLPAADGLVHERVRVDTLVVVARRDHPRLRRRSRREGLDLETYLALEHVQVSSRGRGPTLEDVALRPLGRTRRVRARCQSHAAACGIAAMTDLVATIPEAQARQHLDRDRHRLWPLPLEGCVQETWMYWAPGASADPASRWFRDRVREALNPRARPHPPAPRATSPAKPGEVKR